MANSDLQELRHYILNTSTVLEGIVKARKTTVEEKKALLLERLINTALDVIRMQRVIDDSQE